MFQSCFALLLAPHGLCGLSLCVLGMKPVCRVCHHGHSWKTVFSSIGLTYVSGYAIVEYNQNYTAPIFANFSIVDLQIMLLVKLLFYCLISNYRTL